MVIDDIYDEADCAPKLRVEKAGPQK